MAGFFDFQNSGPGLLGGMEDPRVMGLLGLSQGLFKAGQPSQFPTGFGGAMNHGIQGALGGVQMAQQNALMGAKTGEVKRQADQAAEQQGRIKAFADTLPEADRQRFLVDPGAFLKQAGPFTLPAGGVRFGPDGKPIAEAPTKPQESPLARLMAEQKQFPQGSPQWKIYQQRIEREATHAPAASIVNAPVISTGQKAADTKFADDYIQFATGGYADTQKQLGQLQGVINALEKEENITGPVVGNLPRTARTVTNPRSIAVQEELEEVAQRNLRMILGPQFTEKEGERLISRAYNPALPQEENAKRVKRLFDQIKEAADAKLDASRHFMAHGSLSNWKGKMWTMKDFDPDVDVKKTTPTPKVKRYNPATGRIE